MRFTVTVAAVVALAPVPALGQFIDADQLARVQSVYPAAFFQFTDRGCEPARDTVTTQAELALRRAGIQVVGSEDEGYRHVFQITFRGFPTTVGGREVGCTSTANFELWRVEFLPGDVLDPLDPPTTGKVVAFQWDLLVVGPKDSMTSQHRESADEVATALANEILKARGR